MARKNTTFAKFTESRTEAGRTAGRKVRTENAVKDGLTQAQRRKKRIKDAANGCWWIETYIMGSMSPSEKRLAGIDDE
jgi:hypothetical protein